MAEPTNAARKTLAALRELTSHPDGIGFTQVVEALNYPPSTVHRLLRDIVESGFAVQDPRTKLYWAGPEVAKLVRSRPQEDLLRAVARPVMQQLNRDSGESVFLSVLQGYDLVSLDCLHSAQRLRVWGEPGARGPLHATAQGKAILSQLPVEECDRVIASLTLTQYTPHTITDRAELRQEISMTRERGYATNNEERDEGAVTIAAPIDLSEFNIRAGMSLTAPRARSSMQDLEGRFLQLLVDGAHEVATRMGEILGATPGISAVG